MKCPKCKNLESKVIDSRLIEDWNLIKRRRECEYCQNRFNTFERRSFTELTVIKKDNTKEMYNKEKLKRAILLACVKRDISWKQVDDILYELENKRLWEWQEIQSTEIGEDVLKKLKSIDEVAYVRFASVYKSFSSSSDFKNFV